MSDAYEVLPVETRLLSHLVGRIYDCAIDPDHWEGVLLEIREALDFCNAMFTVWTAPRGDTLLNVTSGIPEPFAETLPGFGDQIVEAWGGAANIAGYALGEPQGPVLGARPVRLDRQLLLSRVAGPTAHHRPHGGRRHARRQPLLLARLRPPRA